MPERTTREEGRPSRLIGRLRVDVLSATYALEHILGSAWAGRPLMVSFCNAHSVNLAAGNDAFVQAMNAALVLNDGVGVDLASRLLHGAAFPENLNGTDFTPLVLGSSPEPLRVYLLGSPPGVAEEAAAKLSQTFPRHEFVGTRDGFFGPDEEEAVAREIEAARPNLILVGMGQPRQELWAAANFARFAAVTMCIGAYIDFAAGKVPRAPPLVRRLRAEWMFRLAQEPRRLASRYLIGNAAFLARVVRQRLGAGRS